MGSLAIGWKGIGVGDSHQLREHSVPYRTHFDGEKDDIGSGNFLLWDVNA